MAKEGVYDKLLCFLGDITFQAPVRTFMDENSIIFDPSMAAGEDHRKIYGQYKRLVDCLLDGFCEDSSISPDQAIQGIKSMSQEPSLKELFQDTIEQVLAAVDFDVFFNVMCKHNLVIQEHALLMLISMTGKVPSSFIQDDQKKEPKAQTSQARKGESTPMVSANQEDEEILRQAMMASQRDEQVRKMRATQEEKELQKTLAMSQLESERLEREKETVQQGMEALSVSARLPAAPFSSSAAPRPIPAAALSATASSSQRPAPRQPMVAKHPQPSPISNSVAASDWLRTAQAEATKSTTQAAVMAEMSKMSPEELKKRQEYLKEQRDKLLALKKAQREKQLHVAEKSSARPSSARAARKAMVSQQPAAPSEEDEKKMAMRKAIADKLKMEVIGKP